ncbi:hypothetical protein Trydic_g16894 [Trypoxylus dichotomus]
MNKLIFCAVLLVVVQAAPKGNPDAKPSLLGGVIAPVTTYHAIAPVVPPIHSVYTVPIHTVYSVPKIVPITYSKTLHPVIY